MITRIYGKCNGSDVLFQKVQSNIGNDVADRSQWTCVVPKAVSGTYVLELFAVDDAGNEGYCATVKYYAYYDSGMLRHRWELTEIGSIWTVDEVAPIFGIPRRSYRQT